MSRLGYKIFASANQHFNLVPEQISGATFLPFFSANGKHLIGECEEAIDFLLAEVEAFLLCHFLIYVLLNYFLFVGVLEPAEGFHIVFLVPPLFGMCILKIKKVQFMSYKKVSVTHDL